MRLNINAIVRNSHAFEKVDGNILYSGHSKIFTNLVYQSRLSNKNFIDIVDNYSLNGDVKNDVNFMEKSAKFFVFDNFLKTVMTILYLISITLIPTCH